MNLFGRSTHNSHEEEKTIPVQAPIPTGNTIIFLHHEADKELWYDLAPHINVLAQRLPNFHWKYYHFRVAAKLEEEQHEQFITDLQETLLFLPCTSPIFLSTFMQKCKLDNRYAEALAKYIQPIPFKNTHGVSQTILDVPLDAYEKGYKRDDACITLIKTIEQKLLHHIGQTQYSPPMVLAERAQNIPYSVKHSERTLASHA